MVGQKLPPKYFEKALQRHFARGVEDRSKFDAEMTCGERVYADNWMDVDEGRNV